MKESRVTITPEDISQILESTIDVKTKCNDDEFKAILLSGSKGLQRMKQKDLKVIINYLNDVKGLKVKKSGTKPDLAGRIEKHIHIPAVTNRIGTLDQYQTLNNPMQQPSNLFNFNFLNQPLTMNNYNATRINDSTNMIIKTPQIRVNSNFGRVKTASETRNLEVVNGDLTLGGKVDPFYAIRHVLDVVNIKSGKTIIPISLNSAQQKDIQNYQYNLHLYYTSQRFKPKNWIKGTSIFFNTEEYDVPPENRKLKKQPSIKKLICYSPVIIPHYNIKPKNRLEINIHGIGKVNELLMVCIVLTRKSEELVKIVLDRKTVNELKKQVMHNDDELVMYNTETVTLNDALTLARIDKPARGKNCNHRSCFDLNIYIDYCHKSKVWNCPICDKPLKFDDLVIDETLTRIVKEVDEHYDKIQLNDDGTYYLIDPITKKRLPSNKTQKENVKESHQNPASTKVIEEHMIDDDSEDDENASTQDLGDFFQDTSSSSNINDDMFTSPNFSITSRGNPNQPDVDYQTNNQDDPIVID